MVGLSQLGVAVHGFIVEYSRVYRSSSLRIMRKRKQDQDLKFAHEVSGLGAVDFKFLVSMREIHRRNESSNLSNSL